ncbi:MAG: DUF4362 domain-containing protein [Oscillospiraceae bacterium]|nr:DUF4362 domain-containing protein [Oscillospiraceae bacterium]
MKRIVILTSLFLMLCFLAGCAEKETSAPEPAEVSSGKEETSDPALVEDDADPLFAENDEEVRDYLSSFENRVGSSDKVFYTTFPVTEDTSIWDRFIERSSAGEKAEITIGQITIEGDLIYSYLFYNGESYYMGVDMSRDKFKGDLDGFYSCRGWYLQLDITDVDEEEYNLSSGKYERVIAYLTQLDYSAIKMEEGQVYNMPVEFGVCSFIRAKAQ